MIDRYFNEEIGKIWSDKTKLDQWLRVELAIIKAMAELGLIDKGEAEEIEKILKSIEIDIEWWLAEDENIHHDLNAFVNERIRHLPPKLQKLFHKYVTSFDIEEPAFHYLLSCSVSLVRNIVIQFLDLFKTMAVRYRYVPMMGMTHGQAAEMQTFGKRCLAWYQDVQLDLENLDRATQNWDYSKISGAVGNYGSINPEIEKKALEILGLQPYYGATQIMPREIYAPIAQAVCQIVMTLDKIALAIRLGARTPDPIYQEPFGKKQTGSSAMPHKKNTIRTEQIEGMARMAQGYSSMILQNIATWEERAIEQSCVERVAWPDLFHVAVQSLNVMMKVLKGLVIYPDNMLLQIVKTRGCYASADAKEFILEKGAKFGLAKQDAYRIVQLAAFNIHEPTEERKKYREQLPASIDEADSSLLGFKEADAPGDRKSVV